MFNNKPKNTQQYQSEIMSALEENKKKYDRQLYADWIVKVYNRCMTACMKPEQKDEEDQEAFKLREVEKQCARNCIRKYDRSYKLFDSVEKRIFDQYMQDQNIDPRSLMETLSQKEMSKSEEDLGRGQ